MRTRRLGGLGGCALLAAQQLAHGLARQRPHRQPVREALLVDAALDRLAERVIDPELFNEAPIAGAAVVGSHDAVEGHLLAPGPGQSDRHGHVFPSKNESRKLPVPRRAVKAHGRRGICHDARPMTPGGPLSTRSTPRPTLVGGALGALVLVLVLGALTLAARPSQ